MIYLIDATDHVTMISCRFGVDARELLELGIAELPVNVNFNDGIGFFSTVPGKADEIYLENCAVNPPSQAVPPVQEPPE